MIVITGGVGFIGSVLAARLNEEGCSDLVIVDRFSTDDKWRNIAKRDFFEIIPVDGLFAWLDLWRKGRGGVSPRRHLVDDI
jgi:ADP-L-glycero-D-manno-heptose 6-epimerase